ncbi:hypothetical protein NXH56_04840 [Bifidobacterium thermophilum]|nr:hypothetical protein [Bifidobacterium thermophilum]
MCEQIRPSGGGQHATGLCGHGKAIMGMFSRCTVANLAYFTDYVTDGPRQAG